MVQGTYLYNDAPNFILTYGRIQVDLKLAGFNEDGVSLTLSVYRLVVIQNANEIIASEIICVSPLKLSECSIMSLVRGQ